jgi:4-hydroxy-4-methyl-2-oxoglutarate aldolase
VPPNSSPECLTRFDTCVLADAADRLGMHPNNRRFARPGLQCLTSGTGVVAGYASTARIRSANAPVLGQSYFRHTEWWAKIGSLPGARIVVIEDVDEVPGYGACVGEVAAAAFLALGCRGAVTNGSGRNIPALSAMGFALFAAHVSPSRAYAHLVEHSCEVDIFGLRVKPGDLLVADRHGLISIPPDSAARVCEVALEVTARKRMFVDFCTSSSFSVEGMEERLRQMYL